ncbi:MAG TPA: hypothetical protein VII52_08045 [Gemmatimonadaceae bacterium]
MPSRIGQYSVIVLKRTLTKALALALLVVLTGTAYSALASSHSALSPKAGRYSGFAGPQAISFKVSADRKTITKLSTAFNPATFCSIPAGESQVRFPTLKVHNGHFSGKVTQTEGTPTHFSIKGRFVTPTSATGKISGSFTIRSLPPCDATAPFSVKRKGK